MISVIVPVYNVERYLRRCVDSILDQTYSDYEVLLIDDGSTDGSPIICDEYAEKYPNIFSFHKSNTGLSDVRNIGVKKSKGEFVTFIDSDDMVSPDYLYELYALIKKYDADMSCGSFVFFDDSAVPAFESKNNNCRVYSGKDACQMLMYGKDFVTSSCNILLKRNIALENPFPVGKYHEDERTTFRYMLASVRVAITDRNLYYYYQRAGSIMHTPGKPVLDEIDAADNYYEVCKNLGVNLKRAARYKKFNLLREILQTYPDLKEYNPEKHEYAVRSIKLCAFLVFFDKNVSNHIRKIIIKILLGKTGF